MLEAAETIEKISKIQWCVQILRRYYPLWTRLFPAVQAGKKINAYTMLCIPCWNKLSSTHQGTADVKDHCASNVKEIQPLLQFETICWHPSRILHVKWVRFLLCRLRLWSLFCPHLLLVNLGFKFNLSKICYKLHFLSS